MNRFKRFVMNTIILTLTSILMKSIGMSFSVYVTSIIGSEGTGLFELIMSIYLFAITLANSGISLSATRIVSEELDSAYGNGTKVAMHKCIGYSLFFGLLACILLSICAPFICSAFLHNRIGPTCLYIIAISLPFSSVTTSLTGYFAGVRRVIKSSFGQIVSVFVKILLCLYFLQLIQPSQIELACTLLILANTISEIADFLLTYFLYVLDKRKLKNTTNAQKNYLQRILHISLPVAVTSYVRSGLSTLKQLLIPICLEKNSSSCNNAFSQYGLIAGMTMPILLFPSVIINSFANLLIPEFARYKEKQDYSSMNEIIVLIFNLVAFIFLTFSEEISYLIYQNFDIVPYLKILCPLIIFMYLDNIIDSMLKGLDKQIGVMFCNIFDLFSSIIFIYTLLPIYGIHGYLIVLYISEILNFTISLIQLYRVSRFKFNYIAYILIPIVCVFVTKYILDCFDIPNNTSPFITNFKIAIFIFIYFIGFLSTKLISKSTKFS